MKTRSRQDVIVRNLRRNCTSTIQALALEVRASRSTIIRDIAALRDEGFVVHTEAGRGGWLSLDAQSIQTTVRLPVAEVFALILGVSAIRAAGNLPFSSLADAGLSKIEKALPADKIRDLRRFLDCLYVGPLAPQVDLSNLGEMEPEVLPAFETAFLCGFFLQFKYRDAKGSDTKRHVEPQAMLILPPLWYLVACDPSRQDFCRFRMDRIGAPVCDEWQSLRCRVVPFAAGIRPVRIV